MTPVTRFERAMAAFDDIHRQDPDTDDVEGSPQPRELVYAQRMTRRLAQLEPNASEALRLAVRAQHLGRWQIPRSAYPNDRVGYLAWRTELKRLHARQAGDILRSVGYDDALIGRVQSLVEKRHLTSDSEAQQLEDVACLVFLEFHLDAFRQQHDDAQVVEILRKTWRKMSPVAREVALRLALPARTDELLRQALSG